MRITFYNIFKKTPKKGCFFNCTELVDGDGEGGQLPGCQFDFHSAVVLAGVVPPLHQLLVGDFSTPPVHPSYFLRSRFLCGIIITSKMITKVLMMRRLKTKISVTKGFGLPQSGWT